MAQSLNRTLFHADNLPVLRGIDTGTVDLIATDPPFNKNKDFHATPDSLASGARFADRWSWERDVHEEWVDQLYDDWRGVYEVVDAARHAAGDDMAAFICWLGVRAIEMHRVLKDTGSIYLHCDPTASHYLKLLMDAIFGAGNFRNEITWKRTATVKGNFGQGSKLWGQATDALLFYSKTNGYVFNQPFGPYSQEYIDKAYRHVEPETGRRYRLVSMIGPGGATKGNPQYEVMGVTRYWRYSKARMQELIDQGLVVQSKPGTVPNRKYYLDEGRGVPVQSLWDDIGNLQASDTERTGYPTQKPLALYERIILASSNEGDLVLDPFAGCATTPVAAERLGRQWVGIDIWEGAHDLVLKRLEDEKRMFVAEQVTYTTEPPVRTDEGEVAAPFLKLKLKRALEPWQRLSHKEIVERLRKAQADGDLVACAGCGRSLEHPFMQLDHIMPRADGGDNWITNRILLCGPCNGRKGADLTLTGLVRQNKRDGWMSDPALAEIVTSKARDYAAGVAAGG